MAASVRKPPVSVLLALLTALVTVLIQLYFFMVLLLDLSSGLMLSLYAMLIVSGIGFAVFCTFICRRFADDKRVNPAWLQPTLRALAKRMQLPEPELHTLNTSGINAFALHGFFDRGHILINNETLTHLHEEEVEAVLAHECSHIAHYHAIVLTVIQGMAFPLTMPISLLLGLLYSVIYGTENFRRVFLTVHQMSTIMLFPLTSMGLALFTRLWEFAADRQAADAVGLEKYIAALKCLHGSFFQHPNLLNLTGEAGGKNAKHGWALSHPSLAQRINALLEHGQS